MKFDRTAPGGGIEVYCTLQTGKVFLEWKFYCEEEEAKDGAETDGAGAFCKETAVRIIVLDGEGNVVLEGWQRIGEEELLKTALLRPRLWNSTKDPYLYTVEAFLIRKRKEEKSDEPWEVMDSITVKFPIRSFRRIPGKGWYLNDEPFCQKAVAYVPPEKAVEKEEFFQDLSLFAEAGANTLCIREPHMQPPCFYEICEEMGFLVWAQGAQQAPDGRLFCRGPFRTGLFYRYKALWREEPFVFLDQESLIRGTNGNYSITVYSNQKKTALYVDGMLFEFQSGETAFVFHEIPFHGLFLCLTAEAGECSMSLSVHRTFTKASLFHDNYPLE